MPSRFSIPVPTDFSLPRDACSYGYFLLAPNHWQPRDQSFSRVLNLAEGPGKVTVIQPDGPGRPLKATTDRTITKPERIQAIAMFTRALRLDEPAKTIADFHRVDRRWKKNGAGRLCRSPSFFEDVIKTVTSCNVAWTSTIIMNQRLCHVVGQGGAFPTPQRLAKTRANTLRARCSVGYRDQRIVDLAKRFATPANRGGVDVAWFEDPSTPDDAIHEKLLDWPGIGPYAAANIMQLLGRYARLPLDSESVRHGKSILGFTGSDAQVMKQVKAHFDPFGVHAFRSYWFELLEHYQSLRGPSHTWDRETTGKSFTAAKMK